MHVPDGVLDAPTSIATGVVALAAVGVALRGARRELDDRVAPMAGLVATFVFAAQMVNFPVGAGTSGHLIGGALAAVLVGPYTAVLCLTVVLMVQSLLFADGGVTALGTNVLLMGLVTVLVAWFVVRIGRRLVPPRPALVGPLAGFAAFVSVPAASLVFVLLFSVGGAAEVPLGTLIASMVGIHTLIGLGEAAITGLVVGSVVATRPDLVYAARPLLAQRTLEIRSEVTA